jgi:hypothetical protein
MPTESGKPLIVISYAREDEPEKPAEDEVKWLSFVTGYLRPAIKHGAVDLWLDRLMPGGADWEREISERLRACDIFILLVSRHSLSSDYVVDKEIAIIRERQAKREDVHFYPLVLTPTPKIALELVSDKNLRPRDGKLLSDYSINERYRRMADAADEIAAIANASGRPHTGRRQSGRSGADRRPFDAVPAEEVQLLDHDSLQRWMRRRHPDVALTIAARAALRVAPLVHLGRRGRTRAASEQELDGLMSTVLRALAPAQLIPQVFYAEEFRAAFRIAADKAEAAAKRAAHSTSRAVCECVSDVAAAAATHFDDQAPRAAFVADAVTLAAEASARGAADHAARAVGGLSSRGASSGPEDDIGVRRERRQQRERDNAARTAATAAEAIGAAAIWEEVQADLGWAEGLDPDALEADGKQSRRPLWLRGQPDWVRDAWRSFRGEATLARRWDVWIDWYEQRLRGGSRGEEYELVFASVPQEEWDKGPAAANAWIRARLLSNETQFVAGNIDIHNIASLKDWLEGQSGETAVAIALRSILRAMPYLAAKLGTAEVAATVFRAVALARVAVRYPFRRASSLHADGEAAPPPRQPPPTHLAALPTPSIMNALAPRGLTTTPPRQAITPKPISPSPPPKSCMRPAPLPPLTSETPKPLRSLHFPSGGSSGGRSAPMPTPSVRRTWASSRTGLSGQRANRSRHRKNGLRSGPRCRPARIGRSGPAGMRSLGGGSRGEDYELVFVGVPREEWDKGPAAANAWIKAHLPNGQTTAPTPDLPQAVSRVEAPFAYGWTASQRVAVVAGAQNLPFYPHFSSEEDHRRALEACRVGGQRLLKALRDGRYNARREYGEALEYYLDDLPKTAGAGNILLAHDQVRILHDMFMADVAMLSEGLRQPPQKRDPQPVRAQRLLRSRATARRGGQRGELVAAFPARRGQRILRCGRGQHAALVRA